MPTFARPALSLVLAALSLSPASSAFNSPLSDEAIREAYFLGQRHDGTFSRLLDKYSKHLPSPKSGPYIRSITFLTPFAKLVHYSDAFVGNYSAQQAALDHRGHQETVEITVEILLTDSYGAIIATPASARSGAPQTYQLRSHDFWKDFQVQVFEGDEIRTSPFHRRTKRPLLSLRRVLQSNRCHSSSRIPGNRLQLRLRHHPCHPARRPRSLGRLRPNRPPLRLIPSGTAISGCPRSALLSTFNFQLSTVNYLRPPP